LTAGCPQLRHCTWVVAGLGDDVAVEQGHLIRSDNQQTRSGARDLTGLGLSQPGDQRLRGFPRFRGFVDPWADTAKVQL